MNQWGLFLGLWLGKIQQATRTIASLGMRVPVWFIILNCAYDFSLEFYNAHYLSRTPNFSSDPHLPSQTPTDLYGPHGPLHPLRAPAQQASWAPWRFADPSLRITVIEDLLYFSVVSSAKKQLSRLSNPHVTHLVLTTKATLHACLLHYHIMWPPPPKKKNQWFKISYSFSKYRNPVMCPFPMNGRSRSRDLPLRNADTSSECGIYSMKVW